MVPEEVAILIPYRGWSLETASAKYGVTPKMVRFRLNITDAKIRVQQTKTK